jgi:transcription initiation factor IIE alpha subunit
MLHTNEGDFSYGIDLNALHYDKCPRCGSVLVSLDWDEPVYARQVQDLW